jgi:8-oxo-dGTP pyrophosphatase MutT (NUDIX family)
MIGTNAETANDMRAALIDEIQNYQTNDAAEQVCIPQFLTLLNEPQCFYRNCFPAHITGSALLLNVTGDKVLMNHHKFLNLWMQFGGHADGDEDILAVAIKETMEESGITSFQPITSDIIDLDIHEISANPKKNEPAHFHYDIRYVMQMTDEQPPIISHESIALKWMTFDEAMDKGDDSLKRLIKKAIQMT